ncbi:hypothetical protein ACFPM3_03000 [Streptomyces coeruleoprunus]|uniref:Uncharacterized protein n=1 Tax=Streptomyces coeruleoprunus TaxID=285563 RepID=A0ABV9XB17_9ACTN
MEAAGELPAAPRDFAVRAQALFGAPGTALDALAARPAAEVLDALA